MFLLLRATSLGTLEGLEDVRERPSLTDIDLRICASRLRTRMSLDPNRIRKLQSEDSSVPGGTTCYTPGPSGSGCTSGPPAISTWSTSLRRAGGERPKEFLNGSRGSLQADGSSCYDRICGPGPAVIEVEDHVCQTSRLAHCDMIALGHNSLSGFHLLRRDQRIGP